MCDLNRNTLKLWSKYR